MGFRPFFWPFNSNDSREKLPSFKIQVDGKELHNLFFQAFGISIVKFPGKLVDFGCRVFVKPIFPVIHAEFPMNKRKKKWQFKMDHESKQHSNLISSLD